MLRKFCEHTYGQSLWFRHVVFFGKTFCTICRETFSLWFANLSLVLKGLQSLIRTGEGKQGQMQKGPRVKCTAYLHRYQFPTFYSVQFERVSLAIALRERPESSKRCLHTRGRRDHLYCRSEPLVQNTPYKRSARASCTGISPNGSMPSSASFCPPDFFEQKIVN